MYIGSRQVRFKGVYLTIRINANRKDFDNSDPQNCTERFPYCSVVRAVSLPSPKNIMTVNIFVYKLSNLIVGSFAS